MRLGVPERADVVGGQPRVTEKLPAKLKEATFGKSLGFLSAIVTIPGCVRLQVLAGSGGTVMRLVMVSKTVLDTGLLALLAKIGLKMMSVNGLLPS